MIHILQPFQPLVVFQIDDGIRFVPDGGHMVFQTVHCILYPIETLRSTHLFQQVNSFGKPQQVVVRQRHLGDGVIGILIAVELAVYHHDGSIIAECFGIAHLLQVVLHGAAADTSVGYLLPQLIGAGIHQLVERGLLAMSQHPVNDLVSHQSFSVDWHKITVLFCHIGKFPIHFVKIFHNHRNFIPVVYPNIASIINNNSFPFKLLHPLYYSFGYSWHTITNS